MKKSKLRRLLAWVEEYQDRLEGVLTRSIRLTFEVNNMKQALLVREQELDSWRELLADMQVDISQLRAGSALTHVTLASGINDSLAQPTNGFSWWRRVFGRAPSQPTYEQGYRDAVRDAMADEPHLRNPRR